MKTLKYLVLSFCFVLVILHSFSSCIERAEREWVSALSNFVMREFAESACILNDNAVSMHAYSSASALVDCADSLLQHNNKLECNSYLHSASSYIAYGLCYQKDSDLVDKLYTTDIVHPLTGMMETGNNQWLVALQEELALDGWLKYCCILNPEKTEFFADLQKKKRINRGNIEKDYRDKTTACRLLSRENLEYGTEIYAVLVESLTSLYAPHILDSIKVSLQEIKLQLDSLPSDQWFLSTMDDSLYESKFNIASLVPIETLSLAVDIMKNPCEKSKEAIEIVEEN